MGEYSDPQRSPRAIGRQRPPVRRFLPWGGSVPTLGLGGFRSLPRSPPRGLATEVARIRGRKPGNSGLDAPFPGPVLDALACPLTAVPRPLRARRQPAHSVPLDAHRLRRPGGLLGFRRCAPPPEQVAPGLRPGGRGLRPPDSKSAPWGAWPHGSALNARHSVCPFDRRPPASLRSVLDARIVRRGSASGCAPGCTPLPPLRVVAAAPAQAVPVIAMRSSRQSLTGAALLPAALLRRWGLYRRTRVA